MRKYTVAHLLLTITSVLASTPFFIVGRQAGGVGQLPSTTAAPSSPVQSTSASAVPTVSSNPVASSPPSSSPPSSTASSISTTVISSATPSSTAVSTSSSSAGSTTSSLPISSSVAQDTTSASTSTNAQGSPVTVVISTTPSTTSSPSPTVTSAPQDNSVPTGTIVGLSVAGGIAALAIIAFIIWKLTRKRFADLDDPDEAIKWPELNRETHNEGGNDGLSRQLSNTYSASALSRNASTFDQSEHADPYAVPPLPQFNPNQPYRDDPYASSNAGYYDPYRGPIPQTFHEGSVEGHENIPMSTYPPGSGRRSPGPSVAYDMGGRGSPALGRASPALGRASPVLGQTQDMGARGIPVAGRTASP